MPMALAAARPPPGSLSKCTFLAPPFKAAVTTVRFGRRRAGANSHGVAPRSGPRDGEWGADPDPSTGTGRMVDEDMATLRRRIREARAALSEDEDDAGGVGVPLPPGRWTELERRHHGSRGSGVRWAARILEALLVNARPGVRAGILALLLLLLAVPAATFFVCAKLVQAVDAVTSAVNGR